MNRLLLLVLLMASTASADIRITAVVNAVDNSIDTNFPDGTKPEGGGEPPEIPAKPANLAIGSIDDDSFDSLTWDDDANVDNWRLFAAYANGDGDPLPEQQILADLDVTTNSYATISGLDAGQWYYWRICPQNAAGIGTCSDRDFATTTGSGGEGPASTFPVFEIYEDFVTTFGGTPIPETNTRYWDDPTYPTTGTVYNTEAALQAAIDANPAAGTVLRLNDGTYDDFTLTIRNGADGVIVAAETKGGVIFTGDSRIVVNEDDSDIFGFSWINSGGGESELIDVNGDDNRICFIHTNNASGDGVTGHHVRVDGARTRVCYSTFEDRPDTGQYVNVFGNPGDTAYARIDHNHFIGGCGDNNGSEAVTLGANQPTIDYFALVDNNYFLNVHNDGGERCAPQEPEIVTVKSRSNLFIHNAWRGNIVRISGRKSRQLLFGWSFVDGDNVDEAAGLFVQGVDNYVVVNYFFDGNPDNTSNQAAIGIDGGCTTNDYEVADDNEISHNTIVNWGASLSIAAYPPCGDIFPDDGRLYNNAILTASGSSVSNDDRGTGWVSGGDVFEPPDGTALTVTAETPEFTLTNGYQIPTAAGNLDGTGSDDASALVTHYIDGTAIPATNPDVGAFPVGADVTTDPMTDIINRSGVDAE